MDFHQVNTAGSWMDISDTQNASNGDHILYCDFCNEIFFEKILLLRHIKSTHAFKNFSYDSCGIKSEDEENLPQEISDAASAAAFYLIPNKSRKKYETSYDKFTQWCQITKVSTYSEPVLLAYFMELTKTKQIKSSTVGCIYSMIKLMLNVKHDVDISKYYKLKAFLKRQGEGYVPKKSGLFTREQFEKFLLEADDENYLATKVAMIIGIFGACRCDELVKLKVSDVQDMGFIFNIDMKNKIDTKTSKSRSFTIAGDSYLNLLRKYIALRPKNMKDQRFFVRYNKGKCVRSVMGINKLGKVPRDVAYFLKLSHYKEYTGDSLRKTSATLLIDQGAYINSSQPEEECKSSTIAEDTIIVKVE